MRHAPAGYACPFCGIAETLPSPAPESAVTSLRATRRLAQAMRDVFRCEGISTRQHNGPTGDQDAWHFHLHVFPRYSEGRLHAGGEVPYTIEERIELTASLRAAFGSAKLVKFYLFFAWR